MQRKASAKLGRDFLLGEIFGVKSRELGFDSHWIKKLPGEEQRKRKGWNRSCHLNVTTGNSSLSLPSDISFIIFQFSFLKI